MFGMFEKPKPKVEIVPSGESKRRDPGAERRGQATFGEGAYLRQVEQGSVDRAYKYPDSAMIDPDRIDQDMTGSPRDPYNEALMNNRINANPDSAKIINDGIKMSQTGSPRDPYNEALMRNQLGAKSNPEDAIKHPHSDDFEGYEYKGISGAWGEPEKAPAVIEPNEMINIRDYEKGVEEGDDNINLRKAA